MAVTIDFEDNLVQGRNPKEFSEQVREGFLIKEYLDGNISLGEFAKEMNMEFIPARDWLISHNIPMTRELNDPELEAKLRQNYRKVAHELGLEG